MTAYARTSGRSGGDVDDRITDAQAIERSLLDPEAFAALFERYAAPMHRYLARRLGISPELRADATAP